MLLHFASCIYVGQSGHNGPCLLMLCPLNGLHILVPMFNMTMLMQLRVRHLKLVITEIWAHWTRQSRGTIFLPRLGSRDLSPLHWTVWFHCQANFSWEDLSCIGWFSPGTDIAEIWCVPIVHSAASIWQHWKPSWLSCAAGDALKGWGGTWGSPTCGMVYGLASVSYFQHGNEEWHPYFHKWCCDWYWHKL